MPRVTLRSRACSNATARLRDRPDLPQHPSGDPQADHGIGNPFLISPTPASSTFAVGARTAIRFFPGDVLPDRSGHEILGKVAQDRGWQAHLPDGLRTVRPLRSRSAGLQARLQGRDRRGIRHAGHEHAGLSAGTPPRILACSKPDALFTFMPGVLGPQPRQAVPAGRPC